MSLPPAEIASPPESSFVDEVVVFSGKLASVGRREARELVERLGGVIADDVTSRTTMLIVGAGDAERRQADDPERPAPTKVRKAHQVNAASPDSVRILREEDFCRLGGLMSAEALDRQYYGVRQIRDKYPAVREDQLRYLEKWSLVRPVAHTDTGRYFGFQDLRVIREVSEALEGGTPFRVVVRSMVAARDGQLALDFGQRSGESPPMKVVALT